MKSYLAFIAATVAVAGLAVATVPAANAADLFSFSFDTGNVAFAYKDGYWDHAHKWHTWHNAREAREYSTRYSATYKDSRHTKEANNGWREEQRDGGRNREDHAPNEPRRN